MTETETETETEPGLVLELGARSRRPPRDPFQALCPFRLTAPELLQAQPQRPFKPRGLMLWDVPPAAHVTIFVGRDVELIVEYGPIPARWFSQQQSFAQIARAVDEGLEPPGWGTWDVVQPGMLIRLRFSERDGDRPLPVGEMQALMWGEALP